MVTGSSEHGLPGRAQQPADEPAEGLIAGQALLSFTPRTRMREQISLGPMPVGRVMQTVDELVVRASPRATFDIVRQVEAWPTHLAHYRYVRMRERAAGGSGIVEMSANRPFGPLNWPTWWLSEMALDADRPAIRFHHIGGITRGMDVEWGFLPHASGTLVRLLHYWNGPSWPVIGRFAAKRVIGPVFIHGIASRTLAGLARVAEQGSIPSDMAVSA